MKPSGPELWFGEVFCYYFKHWTSDQSSQVFYFMIQSWKVDSKNGPNSSGLSKFVGIDRCSQYCHNYLYSCVIIALFLLVS